MGAAAPSAVRNRYDAIARPRCRRTQRPYAGGVVLLCSGQRAGCSAGCRPARRQLASQWPWPVANGLAAQFALEDDEPLADAWQRLFIGPWALPAPPWGSVWLDKESVLFGDSTLALREWMRANGIGLSEQRAEPEDHFGTLLLLAAWLCESGQDEAFNQLLAWHLLPWSGRFLSVFIAGAGNPFYQALGQLAQETLARWQARLPCAVADKPLYR